MGGAFLILLASWLAGGLIVKGMRMALDMEQRPDSDGGGECPSCEEIRKTGWRRVV